MDGTSNTPVDGPPRPIFARPPVVETAIGVQFQPIPGFNLAHFGLFWSRIREEYSKIEFKEPLPPPPHLSTMPPFLPIRAWFMGATDTYLMQLQNDRLVYHWRKISTEDLPVSEYPHYHALRPRFEHLWRQFLDFLKDEGLSEPIPTVCEVIYINHIDVQDVLNIDNRMNESFPILPPDPPSIAKGAGFLDFTEGLFIRPEQVQLRISLNGTVNPRDAKPVFQLQLNALSTPKGHAIEDILSELDAEQQLTVRVFVECTSPKLHAVWGRIEGQ